MKIFDTIKKAIRRQPERRAAAPREVSVYVTARGKKYHFDPCCPSILAAFNSGKAVKMGISKAVAGGYKPCDKCCSSDFTDY